jgi:hypothetical protein
MQFLSDSNNFDKYSRILSVVRSPQGVGKHPQGVGNQNLSLTLQPIVRM